MDKPNLSIHTAGMHRPARSGVRAECQITAITMHFASLLDNVVSAFRRASGCFVYHPRWGRRNVAPSGGDHHIKRLPPRMEPERRRRTPRERPVPPGTAQSRRVYSDLSKEGLQQARPATKGA
eukprot:gene10490-biopygen1767